MCLQWLQPKLRQRRSRNRNANDICGRGGDLHAKQQAGQRGQKQRGPQGAAGSGKYDRGDLDPQPCNAKNADDDRRADDDGSDHRNLLANCPQGIAKARNPLTEPHAGRGIKKQHGNACEYGNHRCILRRKTGDKHRKQQDRKWHKKEYRRDRNHPRAGALVFGHRLQLKALRIGVDAHPDRKKIKDRGQRCRQHDLSVGHPGQLNHHKGTGTHQRRHDLPARRGHSLNSGGKALGIAQLGHCGQRYRTRRCNICRS